MLKNIIDMSIIYRADYPNRQDYVLALHYKMPLVKELRIFCKELQVKRLELEYEYYDDIYPSLLKLQTSPFKGFLLNIYFCCKGLCNKVYSAIRFCVYMFSKILPT